MEAKLLTAKFIDHIIKKIDKKNSFISLETPFSANNRKADIVLVSDKCTAFEIKGEFDNLVKLQQQIEDYRSCFNKVYLITVPKHLANARKIIPKQVGIILYENDHFLNVRKAKCLQKLNKKEILNSISINFLRQELDYKNDCAYSFREYVLKNEAEKNIFNLWKKWLIFKYLDSFKIFKKEKGKSTHPSDLRRLNSKYNDSIIH